MVKVCVAAIPANVSPLEIGRYTVMVPSAPVAGSNVMVPEVALPIFTAPNVPLAPRDNVPVESVAFASVLGAVPAPPPVTIAPEAKAAEEAQADEDEK